MESTTFMNHKVDRTYKVDPESLKLRRQTVAGNIPKITVQIPASQRSPIATVISAHIVQNGTNRLGSHIDSVSDTKVKYSFYGASCNLCVTCLLVP